MKKIKSVTIIGTWRKAKALPAKKWAEQVGQLIAEQGLELISGAGTGISELVVNSYRRHGGKKYTTYLVAPKYMKIVGEKLGPRPDKIIQTKQDYPGRNLTMAKKTELAIALTGNMGVLEEIIFNAKDYNHPVIVIDGYPITDMVKALPNLKKQVKIISNIRSLQNILAKY